MSPRLLRLLAVCALLALALDAPNPAAAASRVLLVRPVEPSGSCAGCRRVTGDGVRVRAGPCTDKTALGLKFKGDKVRCGLWAVGWGLPLQVGLGLPGLGLAHIVYTIDKGEGLLCAWRAIPAAEESLPHTKGSSS